MQERGAILGVLAGATVFRRGGAYDRADHRFVADLLQQSFPVSKQEAMAAAVVAQAVLLGAAETWLRGDAKRAVIEATAVRAIVALVQASP